MNKITCEICGTVFQDTAACCPICGWTHNAGAGEIPAEDPGLEQENFDLDALKAEFLSDTRPAGTAARASSGASKETAAGTKKVFDFDAVNQDPPSDTDEDDGLTYYSEDDGEEEPHRPNVFLVVVLVAFIVLVLLATAFLIFKFLLPGKAEDAQQTLPPTVIAETLETEPTTESTIPTVPCISLALPSGVETLTEAGQMWLLHVVVMPEDTTDEVTYLSEDETIVTVNADGRLTAVGEGTTNIVVTCGSQQIKCPVTVAYAPTTEPETTAAPTEEETEPETEPSNTTLKLKKTDIQFGRLGVYTTLELDCDLDPNEVEWFTSNSSVALVRNGVVTAMGPGIAKITAKYDGQEVTCIVRCKF